MATNARARRGTQLPSGVGAIIFDLDGVVTDTASLHTAAWKRMFDEYLRGRAKKKDGEGRRGSFRPFARSDYLRYVDGKPRADGARDFLRSRKISMPLGQEHDKPTQKTVWALANKKNGYYLELLRKKGPKVYRSSVRFIRGAREDGLKTAIISSSKNCAQILRMTGTQSLFDAKVDGLDLERLGIPGKPDPAMFLEAAKRIDAEPRESAVVEDALSGVEAGHRGGFKPVIGVARSRDARELKEHGADLAVKDLKELKLPAPDARRPRLPSALDQDLNHVLGSRRPVLFLDYDGTLAKIVRDPDKAFLSRGTRRAVRSLSSMCPVIILSGRDVAAVRKFVGLRKVVYAGSHGFDIVLADGTRDKSKWDSFLPTLEDAEEELRRRLGAIDGIIIERKRFGIAVHYRMVSSRDVSKVRRRFDEVSSSFHRLRKTEGKKVFELLPDVPWNKGMAILFLLRKLRLGDRRRNLTIFIGDDLTDEDGFRAIRKTGLGILVSRSPREETRATMALRDPAEVRRFLKKLAKTIEGKAP